jgi:hypothetical protein
MFQQLHHSRFKKFGLGSIGVHKKLALCAILAAFCF